MCGLLAIVRRIAGFRCLSFVACWLIATGMLSAATPHSEETMRDVGRSVPKEADPSWPHHLPRNSALVAIQEDSLDFQAAQGAMSRIRREYADNQLVGVEFHPAFLIRGDSVANLLTGYRFMMLSYEQTVREPLPVGAERPIGLAAGILRPVAIGKENKATVFDGLRDVSSFGKLLAENRVRVEHITDAKLVRDAFCEVFRWEGTGSVEKTSQHTWQVTVSRDLFGKVVQSGSFEVRLRDDLSVESTEWMDGTLVPRGTR